MRGSSSNAFARLFLVYETPGISNAIGELQILSPQEDVDKTVDDSVELSQLPGSLGWLTPLSRASQICLIAFSRTSRCQLLLTLPIITPTES